MASACASRAAERPLLDTGSSSIGSIALHVFGARRRERPSAGGVELQLSDLAVGVGRRAAAATPSPRASSATPAAAPAKLAAAVQPGARRAEARQRADRSWRCAPATAPARGGSRSRAASARSTSSRSASASPSSRTSSSSISAAARRPRLAVRPDRGGRRPVSSTFVVASTRRVRPDRWAVDLAGPRHQRRHRRPDAAGGLRKFGAAATASQYLGMLMARFGVYGLSVFGGYGQRRRRRRAVRVVLRVRRGQRPDRRAAGVLPHRHRRRPRHQPRARPPDRPVAASTATRSSRRWTRRREPSPTRWPSWTQSQRHLPDRRAARSGSPPGSRSPSFALVDGVASSRSQIGDGLEIALLGLARMALPRPQVALVSIELGLLARFSTKEGVLWVQAQLTDNSWLLYPDVRLTGGFAFVTWFKGPQPRPVRADDRRLPPDVPARRLPGRAAARPQLARRHVHHRSRASRTSRSPRRR